MWQRTPRAPSIGSDIMHPRDKRNGESDDERAAAERNLHRDVKTKLSFTWPELGQDVKPRKRWVIPYSVSRTKTRTASSIKARSVIDSDPYSSIIILMKSIVKVIHFFFPSRKIIRYRSVEIIDEDRHENELSAFLAFKKSTCTMTSLWQARHASERPITFRYKF